MQPSIKKDFLVNIHMPAVIEQLLDCVFVNVAQKLGLSENVAQHESRQHTFLLKEVTEETELLVKADFENEVTRLALKMVNDYLSTKTENNIISIDKDQRNGAPRSGRKRA